MFTCIRVHLYKMLYGNLICFNLHKNSSIREEIRKTASGLVIDDNSNNNKNHITILNDIHKPNDNCVCMSEGSRGWKCA